MNFEDLSPELQEKAKACKTPEDMGHFFRTVI